MAEIRNVVIVAHIDPGQSAAEIFETCGLLNDAFYDRLETQ
jgi:translation elongation factor EF-4